MPLMSHQRWLYILILALDANFRLKRRIVSSNHLDPGLTTGLAYFVEETAYQEHLKKYGNQLDVRFTYPCQCIR